ncbi:MAG: UDP-2,3-diacylglucosamine diphosphatase [Planctomycetota bacterium]
MSRADYFASDVHLAPERPAVSERFLRFLDLVKRDAERLFLLGDIFDLWVGPKQTRLPYVLPILEALRALTASAVEVQYLAGNRDFNFDARVNGGPPPRHLPETMSVACGSRRLLLTHGDLLCTGDRAYRRAREIGRSLPVRYAFSAMPLALSTFLSRGYRRLSERVVAAKSRRETAVDFAKVRTHLMSGHDAVVCGHVHRGARYRVSLPDRRTGEFITLGDWTPEGVYLVSRDGRLELRKFP